MKLINFAFFLLVASAMPFANAGLLDDLGKIGKKLEEISNGKNDFTLRGRGVEDSLTYGPLERHKDILNRGEHIKGQEPLWMNKWTNEFNNVSDSITKNCAEYNYSGKSGDKDVIDITYGLIRKMRTDNKEIYPISVAELKSLIPKFSKLIYKPDECIRSAYEMRSLLDQSNYEEVWKQMNADIADWNAEKKRVSEIERKKQEGTDDPRIEKLMNIFFNYHLLSKCESSRKGYAAVLITDEKFREAKGEVKIYTDNLKKIAPSVNTNEVWEKSEAKFNGSLFGLFGDFPLNSQTREYCSMAYRDLIVINGEKNSKNPF